MSTSAHGWSGIRLEHAALNLRPVSKYSVTCSIYSDCNKWGLLDLCRLRILFTLVFYLYLYIDFNRLQWKKPYHHCKNHNDTCNVTMNFCCGNFQIRPNRGRKFTAKVSINRYDKCVQSKIVFFRPNYLNTIRNLLLLTSIFHIFSASSISDTKNVYFVWLAIILCQGIGFSEIYCTLGAYLIPFLLDVPPACVWSKDHD